MSMVRFGTVIAIGGNEQKAGDAAILRTFVELAGGEAARIVIVPSASVEPVERAASYASIFAELGAGHIVTVHPERGSVTRDELVLITNATGIFVTGGDQARLMEHLRATGCADAIVEAVRHGAVYAGTSAGAAVVSRQMLYAVETADGRELVRLGEGLGLVADAIIDQHFTERQRLPRLVAAARERQMVGVGIDEDTAVIWDERGRTEVTGSGAVTFVHPEPDSVRLTILRPQVD